MYVMRHVLVSSTIYTTATRVHALYTWYDEEFEGNNVHSSNPSIVTPMHRHILFNNFLNTKILKPDIGHFTINVT